MDSASPMELDGVGQEQGAPGGEKPTTTRTRSSQRGQRGKRQTAAAASTAAASSSSSRASSGPRIPPFPRRPAPTPEPDDSWTMQEHDQLADVLWSHAMESAPDSDGSHHLLPPSAAFAVPSLAAKPRDQVIAYFRLFVWDIYANFAFSAPLLQPVSPTYALDAPFLNQLVALHHLPDTIERPERISLVPEATLAIPRSAQAVGLLPKPHEVLCAWVSRLRRLFLLTELRTDLTEKFLVELAGPLSASSRPSGAWDGKDDLRLIDQVAREGHASAAVHSRRLDVLLDEFQRRFIDFPPVNAAAASSPIAAASASLPSASGTIVWTPSSIAAIVDVLQHHGLPMRPFQPATPPPPPPTTGAADMADPSGSPAPPASSSSFLPSSVDPLPFVDWHATAVLLARHLPSLCSAARDWRAPLTALLGHLAGEWEETMDGFLTGSPRLLDAACAAFHLSAPPPTPLLPPATALAFRRSQLFWHQLRTRVLNPAMHLFQEETELLEWFSQYAPGLIESQADPAGSPPAAAEATHAAEPAVDGVEATATRASLPSAAAGSPSDLLRGVSLHAAGCANMPSWWQIGFHDLCLLRAVSQVGLRPSDLLSHINRQMSSSPTPPFGWADSAMWRAHSRAIIRQRMGVEAGTPTTTAGTPAPAKPVGSVALEGTEPEPAGTPATVADESLPPVSPLKEVELAPILKRVAQLVRGLSAVATDELMNRLLQSVEVRPPLPGDAPPFPAPSSSVPGPPSSGSPPFRLSAVVSPFLRYFVSTLPFFTPQGQLYGLLKARYHELQPDSQKPRLHALAARSSQPGGGVPMPTPSATSVGPSAAMAPPENPLIASDRAFLRPTRVALTGGWASEKWREQAVGSVAGSADKIGPPGRAQADDDVRMATSEEMPIEDEGEDDEDEGECGGFSPLMAMVEARRRKADLRRMMDQLYTPPQPEARAEAAEPHSISKVLLTPDGRLLLPQQLGDGFVLLSLGGAASLSLGGSAAGVVAAPIGYSCVVAHQSYRRPETLTHYLCRIRPGTEAPASASSAQVCFVVQAADDLPSAAGVGAPFAGSPSVHRGPIVASTAQLAWAEVLARIQASELDAPLAQRFGAIDGDERFGFTCSALQWARAIDVGGQPPTRPTDSPLVQAYLVDPAAVAAGALPSSPLVAGLHSRWSHHQLRYSQVSSSLLGSPPPADVSSARRAECDRQRARDFEAATRREREVATAAAATAAQAMLQKQQASASAAANAAAAVAQAQAASAAHAAHAYAQPMAAYGFHTTQQYAMPSHGWPQQPQQLEMQPPGHATQAHQAQFYQSQMAAWQHAQQHQHHQHQQMQHHQLQQQQQQQQQQSSTPYLASSLIASAAAAVNAQGS